MTSEQSDELNVRRAVFVYEAARIAAIAAKAPIIPERFADRDTAFKMQFLEIIEKQMGNDRFTDAVKAHDSWVKAYEDMGWKYGSVRDTVLKIHPDMVPFADLNNLEQDKDFVFIALCDIARFWIY